MERCVMSESKDLAQRVERLAAERGYLPKEIME